MKRILIVDDIPQYVDTIKVYLEERGELIGAYSLNEAKELLKRGAFDIAIIDIRLKEDDPNNKDGILLLKWLKERSPQTRVIVMSAYREFDYAVDALNAGADYFVRKPIDPQEINSIIDKLIGSDEN